jgi:type II secretory pathway pseudopilin PulG
MAERTIMTREAGFSLVETLVAATVTMSLMAAVVSVMMPGVASSPAFSEAIDLEQRARVAGDTLFLELSRAGAGIADGSHRGPLVDAFAPIVPRRMGVSGPDAFTTTRSDAITIRYVPPTTTQTTVSSYTPGLSAQLAVAPAAGCPATPLCGIGVGDDLFIFDNEGHADTFTTRQVHGATADLQPHDVPATHQYAPGSAVAAGVSRTYYFDPAQRQLRLYDGDQSDVPVVDGVVDLTITYLGDPQPPLAPQPPPGTANCLYDAAGRLDPSLVVLPAAGQALVPLPLTLFRDGPWCGDGPARFDADLLRVRAVRVSLRLEATQAAFRGQGPAFVHPGSAASAERALPDTVVTFDITPRNLNSRR